MEENKIQLKDLQDLKNQLQSDDFVQSDAFAKIAQASMQAGMEALQDVIDPKFMGLRQSTWKKIGWGAAAVGAVAVVGYGAYKIFGEDGGTVSDGTSGAPCF